MTWLTSKPDVLAFTRGDAFACVVNLSDGVGRAAGTPAR